MEVPVPKRLSITPDQAASIAAAGIFNIRASKLAKKLRRQGKITEAEAAERRIELRRQAVRKAAKP